MYGLALSLLAGVMKRVTGCMRLFIHQQSQDWGSGLASVTSCVSWASNLTSLGLYFLYYNLGIMIKRIYFFVHQSLTEFQLVPF